MPTPHPALLNLARRQCLPPGFLVTAAVVDSAIEHGTAPLLDEALRSNDLDGDHDALVLLAIHGLESAARKGASDNALRSLVDIAEGLGIEIAIFKGPAIGDRWYPSSGLRPSVDIDVFIAPKQQDRLGELVEAITNNPASRTVVDTMVAEGRVFEHSAVVKGVAVDVHLDPMNFVVPVRQPDLIWERTEMMQPPDGGPIRVLDLELSVVQALVHLFRDNYADLLHVYDVLLMMDQNPDWDFIEEFAAAEGLTDLVRFSLGVVCDFAQRPSPLPRDVSLANRILIDLFWPERIQLRGDESLARSFRRQSFASFLITRRRVEVARAMVHRILPPRYVIDDRFPGCNCPYPIALIRWRLAQRAENRRDRSREANGAPYAQV